MPEYTFNIVERASGRYYLNVNDRSSAFRTNYSLLTADRSTARQRMTRWERLCARGEWDPRKGAPGKGDRLPLEKATEKFLQAYKEEVRESTYQNMASALKRLKGRVGEDTPVATITAGDIREYLATLRGIASGAAAGTASQATRRDKYGKLNRFFAWLTEKGILDRSPTEKVRRPRKPQGNNFHVLTVGDARHLCRTISEAGDYWMLHIVELALSSGMRQGELKHLRWGDVETGPLQDLDPSAPAEDDVTTVEITDGPGDWKPKQHASYRTTAVYPRGAAVLALRWEGQDDSELVLKRRDLGRVPSQSTWDKWIRHHTTEAGMRPDRNVSLHDMRHSWFSWVLNHLGMAKKAPTVSEMGGHSNVQRTWSYVQASEDGGRSVVLQSVGASEGNERQTAVRKWLCGAPTQIARSEVKIAAKSG